MGKWRFYTVASRKSRETKNVIRSMRIAYCFGMVDYPMLIFMSGIERIGADYNESATISGANVFPKFAYITLSLLKGSIRTNLVMWTVSSVGFFIWGQVFDPVNLPSQTVMPINYSNFAHTKSELFSGKIEKCAYRPNSARHKM